jgi:hypothetical protein
MPLYILLSSLSREKSLRKVTHLTDVLLRLNSGMLSVVS